MSDKAPKRIVAITVLSKTQLTVFEMPNGRYMAWITTPTLIGHAYFDKQGHLIELLLTEDESYNV
jgi:hypothetical protein